MTVRELIALLQQMPQSATVVVWGQGKDEGSWMEVSEVEPAAAILGVAKGEWWPLRSFVPGMLEKSPVEVVVIDYCQSNTEDLKWPNP